MKKITLYKDEKIVHRVEYVNKTLIINILLLMLYILLFRMFETRGYKYATFYSFIVIMFFFAPSLILFIIKIYQRLFQRIYITTHRIIIVHGYLFKLVKIYNIEDIVSVFYKARKFDNVKSPASIKVNFKNKKNYMFKKVKFGPYISQLLSAHIKK